MDLQAQIFLIIGIVAILLLALTIAVSILAYFLIKLYSKVSQAEQENAYQSNHSAAFRNPTMDLDDELSRRYKMHTLERTDRETFKSADDIHKTNKETTKTHNVAKNSHGGSAIDVSEQFIMKRQNGNENSRYNSSIILQVEDKRRNTNSSVHELRTPFNEDRF